MKIVLMLAGLLLASPSNTRLEQTVYLPTCDNYWYVVHAEADSVTLACDPKPDVDDDEDQDVGDHAPPTESNQDLI